MTDPHDLSRRDFLGAGLLAGSLALGARAATDPLPRRPLGRTGLELPILGLGTACAGQSTAVSRSEAIDQGLTLIDTARGYDKAEDALGLALAGRREQVVLTTKAGGEHAAGLSRSLDDSLRRLQTDHVDLLYWHSAGDHTAASAAAADGPLAWLTAQKQAGKARFIGLTAHHNPSRVAAILGAAELDVIMVAMNLVDRHLYGFEQKVLPVARDRGVGVLAMKVLGGERGNNWSRYHGPNPGPHIGAENVDLAFRYAVGLPGVTAAVIGCHTVEQVRQNVALARAYQPLSEAETARVEELGRRLAATWQPRFGSAA